MASLFDLSISNFIFLLVLFATIVSSASTSGNECAYKGDICKIDYEKCFLKQFRDDFEKGRECSSHDIVYGSGKIFKTRTQEISFYIKIVNERYRYAKNLTYRILQYSKIDKKLTPIDGCCSVSENGTCNLPPLKNHENYFHYVFVPKSNPTAYCFYPITERQGKVPWCHENPNPKDPRITPISSKLFDTDYCIFEAPVRFIHHQTYEREENGYLSNVSGIKYDEKVGNVSYGNETRPCEIIRDHEKHIAQSKRSVCYFSKSDLDNVWDEKPACRIKGIYNSEETTWTTIATVVGIATLVLVVALLAKLFYQNYMKIGCIGYSEAVKDLKNKDILEDNEEQNFIQNKDDKKNVGDEDTELIVSKDCNRNFNRRKEHVLEIDELSLFTDEHVKVREDEKGTRVHYYPQNFVKSSTLLLPEDCDNYIPTLRVSKVESSCNECGEEDFSIESPPTCTYVMKSVCTRRKSDLDSGFSPNNPVSSQCSSTSGCDGTTRIHPDSPNDTKLTTCSDIKVFNDAVFINNFDHGYVTKDDTHVSKERPTSSELSQSSSRSSSSSNYDNVPYYEKGFCGDDEQGCYIMSTSEGNSQPIDLATISKQMENSQESSRSPDNVSMNDEKNSFKLSSKQIKITAEKDLVCTENFSLLKKPGIYISK